MSTFEDAPFTYAQTTLVRASPAQILFTRKDTFNLWGEPKGFDLDTYLRRDEVMEKEEWSVLIYKEPWDFRVLVPRDEPETTQKILAHCETNRRPALLRYPDSSTPKQVQSTGIACVFVNPLYAKYKYAKHMLSLLHYVQAPAKDLPEFPVKEWGQPPRAEEIEKGGWKRDVAFSVLYSGVGKKYYASARMGLGPSSLPGWVFKPTPTRTYTIDLSLRAVGRKSGANDPALDGWEWLDADGVRRLEGRVAGEIERQITDRDAGGRFQVAVLPTKGTLYSHCLRDKLSPVTISLGRTRTYGLIAPQRDPASNAPRPFFTYFYETSTTSPACMYISYISHPVPLSLIRRAMEHESCPTAEIWGESGDVYAGQEGVRHKEDNIPCLAVYGGLDVESVDWQFNDKYVAC